MMVTPMKMTRSAISGQPVKTRFKPGQSGDPKRAQEGQEEYRHGHQ